MARLAHELLADIDKETVDFVPNYDEQETEPSVLPTRVPHLLVNGATGIAVGMATNIPPHNLGEVVDACVALLDDPQLSVDDLMRYLPGPDFPTAGFINGARGIRDAYRTGRGRIFVRGPRHDRGDERRQAVDRRHGAALPGQQGAIAGEDRRAGAREAHRRHHGAARRVRQGRHAHGDRAAPRRDRRRRAQQPLPAHAHAERVRHQHGRAGRRPAAAPESAPAASSTSCATGARSSRGGRCYDLRKARDRAHVLEGLAVALANIDEIIALIKAARSPAEARAALEERSWPPGTVTAMLARVSENETRPEGLSQRSRPAARQLPPLGGAGQGDPRPSAAATHRARAGEDPRGVRPADRHDQGSARHPRQHRAPTSVIREELVALREAFADARRTEIMREQLDLTVEDLIEEADVVVTLSHAGYAKAQPVSDYQAQRRGGRGKAATRMKDEDFIDKLFVANTHDTLLCFTSRGKVVLAQGLRAAGRRARRARTSDGEPAAAPGGRAHQRRAAGARLRRGPVRVHGDERRHGEEDAASTPSRARDATASSRSICARTTSSSTSRSRTARSTSSCARATARRSASPSATCARWAARRRACAACACNPVRR